MVASAGVSLLIMPFVVHKLGDRMYGIWTLVATFVGYYGALELGLGPAVARYLAKSIGEGNPEDGNRVFNTAFRIYALLGLGVLAVTGIIAPLAPWLVKNRQDATLFSELVLILGLSFAIQLPTRVFNGALQAHLRFDLVAGFELVSLAIRTVLVVAALLAGYQVLALAVATLIASLPAMVLNVTYAFKELPYLRIDRKYWEGSTAKLLFSFSAFSLVVYLGNILRFQVDNLVVAAFVGLAAVTHYRIAGTLGQAFFSFMQALMGFYAPVFSLKEGAEDHTGIRKTLLFGCRLSICVTAFISFGMIAWGKPFITRWMGPSYVDAYPVLVVLAAAYFLQLSQLPAAGMLFGVSKHVFLAVQNSVEGVVNLALSIILARKYGMIGVALGTLIPACITKIVIQPIYVCRVAKLDYFQFVRRMGRTLAAAGASLVLPTLLAIRLAAPDYKTLCLIAVVSIIVYAGLMWLLDFSAGEKRVLITGVWPQFAGRSTVE